MLAPPGKPIDLQEIPANLAPDPLSYGEWFDQTGDRKRRVAVGVKRYALVADRLRRKPRWADFLDPETMDLLPLRHLEAESPAERRLRLRQVERLLKNRREQALEVSAKGYLG